MAESVRIESPPFPTRSRARATRRRLSRFASRLWSYRDLLFQLTLRDVRIRYKQAVMGFAWALLMPALIVAAGSLVRVAIARMGGGDIDSGDVAGIAAKSVPWAFFVGALGFTTNSLIGNMNLVTKVFFPRSVLPLSATLAQGFDALVALTCLLAVLLLLGFPPSFAALWAIPLLALLFLFTAGVGLIVAAANLFFRDVKYLVQVGVTFGIFFTPVFFEPEMFGAMGAKLMMLNPLSPLLEGLRLCLVEGHPLTQSLLATADSGETFLVWTPLYLVYGVAVAVLTALAGTLLFEKLEPLFAEYV